eukprot:TRINITY_DN44903_c0_g1_i1.p1 TRINITY_DN44903_c0_g1~~TRINITY_DN44903_c0_g1_i1.p1  ORF type:complete len:352 (-),score=70.90 TRINITY_DN44903_c0_g1_i1:8-1036(-)
MGAKGSTELGADELRAPAVLAAPSQERLQSLAAEAGDAFAKGLWAVAEAEQRRWIAERDRLEKADQDLRAAQKQLEEERKRFEEEKLRYGPGGLELLDPVKLNVGGETTLEVSRETLTQCQGSFLASAFSNWDQPKDSQGRVFIDFSARLFVPLVDYLRARRTECNAAALAQPPSFSDHDDERNFCAMLQHFGILDWVFHQEPIVFKLDLADFTYAMLPQQSPDLNQAMTDMRGISVEVPRGWEVLRTSSSGFEEIITMLCGHSWGAGLLLALDDVESSELANIAGFRTSISDSGAPGSRFDKAVNWFETVSPDCRRFKFAGSSYRLIIRMQCRRGPVLIAS